MEQKQDIVTPNTQRWTVSKIDELVKEFSAFEMKDGQLNMGDGLTIACALMTARFETENLTADEIADLIIAFNNCHPQNEAIKRHLVMQALFFAKTIARLTFDSHSYEIFKSPKINMRSNYEYFEKRKGINKAQIYGPFEESYIGIPKVTGKISTGLCKCCSSHEVDKIEIQKIVDIKNVSRLNLEKDGMLIISL